MANNRRRDRQRDVFNVPNQRLLSDFIVSVPSRVSPFLSRRPVFDVDPELDRRFFSPAKQQKAPRVAVTKFGRPARLVALSRPRPPKVHARAGGPYRSPFYSGIGFSDPKSVMVCVRRKARREVMHALGIAGRRGRGSGGRKRNYYSDVRC